MKQVSKSEFVARLIMIGVGHLIDGNEEMAAGAFEAADTMRQHLSDDWHLTYDKTVN